MKRACGRAIGKPVTPALLCDAMHETAFPLDLAAGRRHA
jgi:hypothetical protein